MTYKQTLDYLFTKLPMFQRIGKSAYKADLSNTIALMNALGNPQNNFKAIHIAGTNGKGSTSHFIASILQEKGLKVGLHTSPHLKDFRERIQINGKMCDEDFVIKFVNDNKQIIEDIEPSFFELSVAMAFKYFENRVDIAVIEVGMGGRLDSTNVLSPILSIITNISFDHTQFLGTTLESIASEKAGIIKPDTPVVISQTQQETKQVFIDKARLTKSRIEFADSIYHINNVRENENELVIDVYNNKELKYQNLILGLQGDYQQKNILGVITAIDVLNDLGFDISETILRKGIRNVLHNVPILGRWQHIGSNPTIICDTGHNEDGLRYVVKQLKRLQKPLHIVLGVVNDKDLSKIFPLLPKDAVYYLCKADIPRGLDADVLNGMFQQQGKFHIFGVYPSVREALESAKAQAKNEDVIFVGGSTFTVAEVL
ncbi:MAG: bifunctional folylpolyglutamate synthase/dihydrofolate synthase [Bacteroidales bacterium]|jgi:dihydrofolate synthase/folylpolyglutamate synthase|nr:bifunctional folylpolyglutamate synthase/dihydrofolate synthase [Bacteroidales bacterium]